MGLFPQLIDTRSRVVPANPSDNFWYSNILSSLQTGSGVVVDEATAVKFLAVYDCVTLISGDVARLPLILYQKSKDGSKSRVLTHPLYDIVHNAPNDEMTSFNWRESLATHTLLWGNHYSQIARDGKGEVVEIYPLPDPGGVQVYRKKETGKIKYRWFNGANEVDRGREDVLHVPGWGFNGLVGQSVISIARESIGIGVAADKFSSTFFGSGTHPGAVVSFPLDIAGKMDDKQQKAYMAELKKQYSGLGNAHGLMAFFNGEEFKQTTMPLKDAQFLESREFQKLEICGMYKVPPHKIAIHGANSNYNNLEQENQSYVDSCLIHWLVRYEQCFNHQLLTPAERKKGLYFEFLVDGLLRGDSESRAKYFTSQWQIGAMTSNEIRAKENMNPLPQDQNGDQAMVPLNFIPAKDAGLQQKDDSGGDVLNKDDENRLIAWAKRESTNHSAQREQRSVTLRDRIIKRYRPLVRSAAQTVINRETKAVLRQAKNSETGDWLDDFYQDLAGYIRSKMAPILTSFSGAIADIAIDEVNTDIDSNQVEGFISDYVDTYVVRHISSSAGQISSLYTEENPKDLIQQRMDEWHEKRADKVTVRETVQASSATYQAVAFMAGMATYFRNRGASTCPYCKKLNGMKVRSGEYLVQDGDELAPDGHEPMKINGSKAHAPIHPGCDCYMSIT